ncbi:hypothetical protein CHARACLAT_006110 [Characodon lateralis]|uniref:Uncharacterized protein n=1 Tax=Characodon lateralis TaxID=208331 RepID=A0ABU7E7F0_9TELE|nr:hypothetical protein [Characodon lateralis]
MNLNTTQDLHLSALLMEVKDLRLRRQNGALAAWMARDKKSAIVIAPSLISPIYLVAICCYRPIPLFTRSSCCRGPYQIQIQPF